ncbi:hypothetical protein P378_02970 [Desulforamulus profundi]|uniref:Uncharacterized protein n=1 Tax=Desulforamulus profundi TaxID=1383067 RepID=A0A2C6L414_9FIRM|nr:hypothetical protein [Desulforamulus profundi]PHJ39521.1 hypothetical protein P378_02970 [Desulforamulus profundi]
MIRIYADYITSEKCGAGGCFQVISVIQEDAYGNEKELIDRIDQGIHYRTPEQVVKDLGLNPSEVDYELIAVTPERS